MQKDEIQSVKILKVRFDKVTLEEATAKAISLAKAVKISQICTPNPEILLAAQKNEKYLTILNQSALNIPDGIGILWAAKYLKITENNRSKLFKFLKWIFSLKTMIFYPKYCRTVLTERVTGVDLMKTICEKAAKENLKIFLLGAAEGVAEKTKLILGKKYPGLKIVGTHSGSAKTDKEQAILSKINKSEANILFVAFGAPSQEIWIHRNLKNFRSVKLAMGVGGSFDFIAGVRKRAPVWMQKSGLEWLYRVITQPSRLKRIYNATIKFPTTILKKSLKS